VSRAITIFHLFCRPSFSLENIRGDPHIRERKFGSKKMSLTLRWPALPAHPTESPQQTRVSVAIRRAARAALAGVKQVARAVLVLGIFAVMLVAAMALGLLIWVPHSHVNW
jgi:hypothetical protein